MSTSVQSLVKASEEKAFQDAKAQARLKPLTQAQVLVQLENRARSTFWWLRRFGAEGREQRPQHEIEQKRLELSVLVQVRDRIMTREGKPNESQ